MDQNTFPYLFFGFVLVLIAVIAIVATRAQIQRTRDIAQLAQQLGFQFIAKDWRGPTLPPHFKTLLHHDYADYSSVMIGTASGLPVSLFDFTCGQGKQRRTQSVAFFSHSSQLPHFLIHPEGVFDRIGDHFLHNDIDFPTSPEFSRRFVLQSPDEAATRNLFSPSLLAFFEQIPPDREWHVESTGANLIIDRPDYVVDVANLPAFLNDTAALAQTILSTQGFPTR